jgi:serpin B
MYQSGKYAYGEDTDVQVLKLPYTGKELEMVVILPKKVDGLAAIEDKLNPQTLTGWISRTRERSMDMVGLPKFKSENKFKLRDTLMKMGMVKAFTTADFTGIATKERLQIGAVIHQSFIDVNEQGTEAAAATAVEIRTTSAALNPDPRFIADHPFLYLIRDTRNGSILFLGRFVSPE